MKFSQLELVAFVASVASAQTLNIPTRVGEIISLSAPNTITGSFDGGNAEYDRGHACDSDEDTGSDNAVFILQDGASLSNVIIGNAALEGVHCLGSCTLTNVWFRDVCEDAISILGTGDALIVGGGAQEAVDKVVQHNGAGTVTIRDFTVINAGKLYRSCGDCTNNEAKSPRKVIVENVRAYGMTADLVGINSNFGDVATISGSCGSTKKVCQEFKGVNKGNGAKSEKVDTTASCLGAQGLIATLPACDAADGLTGSDLPSVSASVQAPAATIEPTVSAKPTVTANPTSAAEVTPEPTYITFDPEQPTITAAPSTLVTKTSATSAAPEETGSSGSVALYGQCGGQDYTGATKCASGTCAEQNQWYSQCV